MQDLFCNIRGKAWDLCTTSAGGGGGGGGGGDKNVIGLAVSPYDVQG